MQKFIETIEGENGRPVPGASITVYNAGTSTPATIYLSNGGAATANPLTADSTGMFYFYAADGRYDIVITSGTSTKTISDILLEDPSDASPVNVSSLTATTATITTLNGSTPVNTSTLAASSGSSLIGFINSLTGSIAATIQDKLRRFTDILDFSSITSADATTVSKYVPSGTHTTTLTSTQLTGPYIGPGQIVDAASNKRGKYFSSAKSAPSSYGSENSIETAFNGDLSNVNFAVEHRITGTSTAGQPTTGYSYVPEIIPHYTFMYNSSGWNQSTTTNDGRTGICAYRTNIFHTGQGDVVAYNANVYCNSTKSGSTSFLSNPAAAMFNGDVSSGADGVYLNPYEIGMTDNGYDVAGVGHVIKMNRTNSTAAKNAWWCGYRAQSIGTKEIDVGYSAYGPMNIGIDFSFATLPSSGTYINPAIVMKADQRIYGNANATDASGIGRYSSSLNTDYFSYSSSLSAWNFVVGNASVLQLYTTKVGCNRNIAVLRAGDGVQIKEGSNAKMGTATLVAGTATVLNTSVTANSRIFLTSNVDGGTPGFLRVSAKTASTSFVITSSSGTDTSTVAWLIVEPA